MAPPLSLRASHRAFASRRAELAELSRLSLRVLLACFCAVGSPAVHAQEVYLSAEHRIAGLRAGIAPELYGTRLLLAAKPSHPARYVALRFQHESTLRIYGRERQGTRAPEDDVFVLVVDLADMRIPADGRLLYRVVTDGLWSTDPANPRRVFDPATALEWSVVEVDPRQVSRQENPQVLDSGLLRFVYSDRPGRRVALIGEFNGWDPYMHVLTEVAPGKYVIELALPPGPNFYLFLVDGVRTADPLNPRRGSDPWGRRVCVVPASRVAAR